MFVYSQPTSALYRILEITIKLGSYRINVGSIAFAIEADYEA